MRICYVSLVGVAVLLSGCLGGGDRHGPYGPTADFQPWPPPEIVQSGPIPVHAPESYVWDGSEYVGLYGDQHVYWNSGTWDVCGAVMLERIHGWETDHPAWRSEAVSYYRGRDPVPVIHGLAVPYDEELIGSDTVNTMPPGTLAAFCGLGPARPTLMESINKALGIMDLIWVESPSLPGTELWYNGVVNGSSAAGQAWRPHLQAGPTMNKESESRRSV